MQEKLGFQGAEQQDGLIIYTNVSFLGSSHPAAASASVSQLNLLAAFVFGSESLLNFPQHEGHDERARQHREHVQAREQRGLIALVKMPVEVPTTHKVQVGGVDLAQGAAGDQNMEQLVALTQEVAAPGKAALRQRTGEEEPAAEEERHLAYVIQQGGVFSG